MIKVNYASVDSWFKFITQFKRDSVIKPGNVYTYVYSSKKDYDVDILRFFDILPLTFITDVDYSKKMFKGINLHHMPLNERFYWYDTIMSLLKRISGVGMNASSLRFLNYQNMRKIYPEANRVIRQYYFSSVSFLRFIPIDNMSEIIRFYANTYYEATYNEVAKKFMEYENK